MYVCFYRRKVCSGIEIMKMAICHNSDLCATNCHHRQTNIDMRSYTVYYSNSSVLHNKMI